MNEALYPGLVLVSVVGVGRFVLSTLRARPRPAAGHLAPPATGADAPTRGAATKRGGGNGAAAAGRSWVVPVGLYVALLGLALVLSCVFVDGWLCRAWGGALGGAHVCLAHPLFLGCDLVFAGLLASLMASLRPGS